MTRVVHGAAEFRSLCDAARSSGQRIGFVPTMGALHEGHLALVDRARQDADLVAVSIFVNPKQFGPSEDFGKYPRTLPADTQVCASRNVDVIFAPSPQEMYPPGFATYVDLTGVTEVLEGPLRPGHFRGVATVVARLFGLAGPCTAVFGRKDYQQWRVITAMVNDLALPIRIIGHPTIREPDGLAMSSRNRYLDPEARARAASVPRSLRAALTSFAAGERDATKLASVVTAVLSPVADSIDYVAVADPSDLSPLARVNDRAVVAVALKIGTTRLIDNIVLGEETF